MLARVQCCVRALLMPAADAMVGVVVKRRWRVGVWLWLLLLLCA